MYASPSYIARRGQLRTPRDLAKHEIVCVSHPPRLREWRFRLAGREQIVRLTPRFMVTKVDAMLSAVRAGAGIARTLSYQVSDDIASGASVRLLRDFEPPPLPVISSSRQGGICREPSARFWITQRQPSTRCA
jgi:DNA-binding transcriptional LysR family regulator